MVIFIGVDRIQMRLRQVRARMTWLEAYFRDANEVSSYYVDQYLRLSDQEQKFQYALDKKRGDA